MGICGYEVNIIKKKEPNSINDKTSTNQDDNNYIIAEMEIKDNVVNKDIRIIYSYDEFHRHDDFKPLKAEESNEEEIKKCEIRINNELISFNYVHKFEKKGKYIIKYSFKNNLTKSNYLFFKCENFTKIDLSNFDSKRLTRMNCMFSDCKSLASINLNNVDTTNVIDMNHMFYKCVSLTNIDISSFNTENVVYMQAMFEGCKSLKDLNLSNFNTKNVTSMVWMFSGCTSLTYLDLSNFTTKKVEELNTDEMFYKCDNLKVENVKVKDEKLLFILKNNFYI